jgi:hypothetical protein
MEDLLRGNEHRASRCSHWEGVESPRTCCHFTLAVSFALRTEKKDGHGVPVPYEFWRGSIKLIFSDYCELQDYYLAWRFAFLAAFRCDFEYFFIALCCFLEAFFNFLFCCLADFLSYSRELRAYSATPGLCALAGSDQATLHTARSVKTAIRFMCSFLLAPKTASVYTYRAHLRYCETA